MNATKAIRQFFETGEHGRKVNAKELIEFKGSCDPDEYQGLGMQACEALGETYDAPEA
jgi:hypothetical protein